MEGEGVSWRYVAYSLALELGWSDVDQMLESMTLLQFNEWLAFFKIRDRQRAGANAATARPQKYGKSWEEQQRLSGDILRAFQGWEKRTKRSEPQLN